MITELSQKMNAKDFLYLVKNKSGSIKSVQFVAPKLGTNSLGYFKVIFNYGQQYKHTEPSRRK